MDRRFSDPLVGPELVVFLLRQLADNRVIIIRKALIVIFNLSINDQGILDLLVGGGLFDQFVDLLENKREEEIWINCMQTIGCSNQRKDQRVNPAIQALFLHPRLIESIMGLLQQ